VCGGLWLNQQQKKRVRTLHLKEKGEKMKDRYLVTLEIETYDGDPKSWNWDNLYIGEENVRIIETQFKGRVLPTEGEGEE